MKKLLNKTNIFVVALVFLAVGFVSLINPEKADAQVTVPDGCIPCNEEFFTVSAKEPDPTPTPTTAPVPPSCNVTCTTNSDCPSNLSCSGGKCRNTGCVSETDCTCPKLCNAACGSNGECGSGRVCSNGVCRHPDCINETDCDCVAVANTVATSTPKAGLPNAGFPLPTIIQFSAGFVLILVALAIAL